MSAIRSILLHLDATVPAPARLEFARGLALRHEANLAAMFVAEASQPSVRMAFSEAPVQRLAAEDRAEEASTRALFDDAASRGGPAMRWLDGSGTDPVGAFCRQALYADLLVLGQRSADARAPHGAPAGFVESVLIASGKPALVFPYYGAFATIGQHVLIGWNATPQAARAVGAALPWLRAAREVHVLQADDRLAAGAAGDIDIAAYLGFHGIAATLHPYRRVAADAGNALLSHASDVDADLLVMGCYGHSRTREFVLGGATRLVLQTMTVPVLMAH